MTATGPPLRGAGPSAARPEGPGDRSVTGAAELETWLVGRVAELAGLSRDQVRSGDRFHRLGLTSLQLTRLTTELSRFLGRTLPPTSAWTWPTPCELAQALSRGEVPPAAVPVAGGEGGGGGGGGEERDSWAAAVRSDLGSEPIAVVGMAGRFPGAAGVEELWRLLADGGDAIREIPADRWDADAWYAPPAGTPGRMSTRWGGFLDDIAGFDPLFFGISPAEARHMDPQQRLALELAWETLEDSGTVPRALRGRRIGVFMGAMWTTYAALTAADPARITSYSAPGGDLSIISARIAYTLGLRGPAITVNTACSSSLVALHQACRSIRSGECEAALAGGVDLLCGPQETVAMSHFGAMAPDGRCKPFDAAANGYVRGEGGGMVLLKPLSRALADGDEVLCTVLGSAVNNDGFSNGLTAPSPQAQEDVIRRACEDAGIAPGDVAYVETHGTGTSLGDPIEAGALGAVYGTGRPRGDRLLLGAVKGNLGHLEAAAGITGLIKAACALHRREIPGNLHFHRPSPHIDFEGWGLEVPVRPRPWPGPPGAPALAGVSSFGFGGTNCHVILSGHGTRGADASTGPARSAPGRAGDIDTHTGVGTGTGTGTGSIDDAGSISSAGSTSSLTSAAFVGRAAPLRPPGRPRRAAAKGSAVPRTRGPVFVFGGQGSQWPGMAASLAGDPAAARVLRNCDRAFAPHLGGSLADALLGGTRPLTDTRWIQAAVFTLQVALAERWASYGVLPSVVVGQSMGEVAAAHVSGAIGLDDAARVLSERTRLITPARGRGGMALVRLDRAALAALIDGLGPTDLAIAVIGGEDRTVVAGGDRPLRTLAGRVAEAGADFHRVDVDYASHSSHMDPFLPDLEAALSRMSTGPAHAVFWSTVTGGPLDGTALGASYWARNLRETVRFGPALARLGEAGHRVFIEVNPHPICQDDIRSCAPDALAVPSLSRHADPDEVWENAVEAVRSARASAGGTASPRPVALGTGQPEHTDPAGGRPRLLVLTGHTPRALTAAAALMARHLSAVSGGSDAAVLDAVCRTAGRDRQHHRHRLAVVADSARSARRHLDTVADAPGKGAAPAEGRDWYRGEVSAPVAGVALVLPGAGTADPSAAPALCARFPAFRRAAHACADALGAHGGPDLGDWLTGAAPKAPGTAADATTFTWGVGLAALLMSWGLPVSAVTGEGIGAVAAAAVTGALTLPDAVRTVLAHRDGQGGGRTGTGAAGRPGPPVVDARALVALRPQEPRIPFLEPSTLAPYPGRALNAEYWSRLAASDRPCAPAAGRITVGGSALCVLDLRTRDPEGPGIPGIPGSPGGPKDPEGPEGPEGSGGPAHGTPTPAPDAAAPPPGVVRLRRAGPPLDVLLHAVAALFVAGVDLDWDRLPVPAGGRARLPAYPWQRTRHWITDEPPRAPGEPPKAPGQALAPAAPETSRPDTGPGGDTGPSAPDDLDSVQEHLATVVGGLLGIPSTEVAPDRTLRSLGADSLAAMQLRNTTMKRFGVELPVSRWLADTDLLGLAAEIHARAGDDGAEAAGRDDASYEEILL
ncbi:beta-ketoacyl synthase N-terminal-like domain-containing protein [Streptomyces sp. NPDC093252]|uniref:type I polyketide synthase n=1 Tax=Streptomyces sp. NPDC093252 TaxID=3154980 RepID=UPI003429CCBD